jgi:hypothetical protein
MNINDRLVASRLRECSEQFREARVIRITHGAFAICLDPFGVLNPEVVVDLVPKLGVTTDSVRRGNWLGERFKLGAGPFV